MNGREKDWYYNFLFVVLKLWIKYIILVMVLLVMDGIIFFLFVLLIVFFFYNYGKGFFEMGYLLGVFGFLFLGYLVGLVMNYGYVVNVVGGMVVVVVGGGGVLGLWGLWRFYLWVGLFFL